MTTDHSFSLLDDPWIRCVLTDGSDREVSIRHVFDGSVAIAEIRGDSPTQDYAMLRMLLAIFWRAHRHDADVRPGQTFDLEVWRDDAWDAARSNAPDDDVLAYLREHAARFDLLHPTQPFMQVADLATQSGAAAPISRIIPEAETSLFTMRAGAGAESLLPAEAARWLVTCQAYDYSGIKSGALGDPRVKGSKGYPIGTGWTGQTGGTTVLGRTLRETLVLNTSSRCLTSGEKDRPVWEREPDGAAERPFPQPTGPADLATWQSRRIRLFVDAGRITSVLVCNGDRIPNAGANVLDDPMTPYRYSANKSTKANDVFYARPYETDRMMWRSLEPLLARDGDLDLKRGVKPGKRPGTLEDLALAELHSETDLEILNVRLTSASYGSNQSSAATTVDSRIGIPRALLGGSSAYARQSVLAAAQCTLAAAVNLGTFAGRLFQAAGSEYAFQPPATDSVLADLEPEFTDWLRRLDIARIDEACAFWQSRVGRVINDRAQTLLRGAGPKALIGREIATNDRTITVSAGSAYRLLQRDLRASLPLTARASDDGSHHSPSGSREETQSPHPSPATSGVSR